MIDYLVTFANEGAGCVAGVNGVPLFEDLRGSGLNSARMVNEWIRPGRNFATAFIYWPPGKEFEKATARCAIRWESAQREQDGSRSKRTELASFSWPLAAPESYPFQFRQEFGVADAPATRLWGDAERIERIEPGDRQQVLALATALRGAIVARNTAVLLKLTRYKFEDRARAEGHSADEVLAAAEELYGELVSPPEFAVAEIPEQVLVIEPVADNQVFRVTRGGRDRLISVEDGSTRRRIDVFVARIGGEWMVVR